MKCLDGDWSTLTCQHYPSMGSKKDLRTSSTRGWSQNRVKAIPTRSITGSYQMNLPNSHPESARHDLGIEVMKKDIAQVV